jgi:hypothetical protein
VRCEQGCEGSCTAALGNPALGRPGNCVHLQSDRLYHYQLCSEAVLGHQPYAGLHRTRAEKGCEVPMQAAQVFWPDLQVRWGSDAGSVIRERQSQGTGEGACSFCGRQACPQGLEADHEVEE